MSSLQQRPKPSGRKQPSIPPGLRERALHAMLTDLSAQLDLDSLARRSLEHALSGSGCEVAGIAEVDRPAGVFRYRWLAGFAEPDAVKREHFELQSGLAGAVLARNETVAMADYQGWTEGLPEFKSMGLSAALGTPIRQTGEIRAVLCVGWRDGVHRPGPAERRWLETVARQLGIGYAREAATAALKHSEARLREILDSVPELIYHVRLPEQVPEFVGPRLPEMAGLDPAALIAGEQHWPDLVHAEDRSRVQAALADAIAAGRREFTTEYRIHRADTGAIVWLRDRSRLEYGADGEPVRMTGVVSDITELRESMERERAAEGRTATLVQTLPLAIASYDAEGRIVEHNPAAAHLLHAPEGMSLVGRHLSEFIDPDQWPLFMQRTREELAAGGAVVGHRYRIRRLDGSWGYAEGGSALLEDREPPLIALFAQDTSARVAAEAALRERDQELAAITANTPDAVMRFDSDFRLTFVNPAALAYSGLQAEAMLGRRAEEIEAPGEAAAQFHSALEAALADGQESSLRLSYPTPQGLREFASRIVVERDNAGKVTGLLTVTRDITELVDAQRALEEQAWALSERVKELKALLELTRLTADHGISEPELLRRAIRLIPPAFQRPRETGACVRMGGRLVNRHRWRAGQATFCADMRVDGSELGTLQVTRRDRPHGDAEAFLAEERALVKALATALASGIEARRVRIREQRQTRALQALSAVAQAAVRARSEAGLVRGVCRAITGIAGYRLAWVGFARQDEARTIEIVAWAGHNRGYVEQLNLSWADNEHGQGPGGVAIRTGRPVVANDIARSRRFAPWRDAARQRGYASCATLPFTLDGGERGMLAIYATETAAFDSQELALLTQLADELGHGLRALRGEARRRQAAAAQRELAAQRERIVERSSDGLLIVDDAGVVRYANTAAGRLFGQSRRRLVGELLGLPMIAGDWTEIELGGQRGQAVPVEMRAVPIDWHGEPAQLVLLHDLRERLQAEQEKLASAEQLQRTLVQTIEAVALTVEKRDPYTSGHQRRVAELAMAIGRQLGLEDDRVAGIGLGAQIHDIGKISVPAEILSRPGRLMGAEMELVKMHPQTGFEIVKDIAFTWPIPQMILQHHERLDGSGYPQGLKGDKILMEARILAVADVVEAMASHRPYRPGLGQATALNEARKQAGKQLDAAVVQACLAVFEEGFRFSQLGLPEVRA